MKGIVFTEFVEMVEQQYSSETMDRVLDESKLASGGAYTSVGAYDHHELMVLATKLSEITGEPVPYLIQMFGRYLFCSFHALYPSFFVGPNTAIDFLAQIEDVIHAEVRKIYSDANPPVFEVTRTSSSQLVMVYHSHRHLGDLAQGLIEACIAHFRQPLALLREDIPGQEQSVRFIISVPS